MRDVETLYGALDWQRLGARSLVRHYLSVDAFIELSTEQCRYIVFTAILFIYIMFPVTSQRTLFHFCVYVFAMIDFRYFHVPLGNMPADPTLFGADLFFARNLVKHNFVLWCSDMDRPDLGGRETDDNMYVILQLRMNVL